MKKIVVGADRSGRPLKDAVVEYLEAIGYQVTDVGMVSEDNFKAYYDVAPKVAEAIQSGAFEKGLAFCGTGAGMSIITNKHKGVYAVATEGSYTARMASVINSANVLCMGGWVVAPQQAIDMVDRWLNTGFTEGLEEKKDFLCNAYDLVKDIEDKNFK